MTCFVREKEREREKKKQKNLNDWPTFFSLVFILCCLSE